MPKVPHSSCRPSVVEEGANGAGGAQAAAAYVVAAGGGRVRDVTERYLGKARSQIIMLRRRHERVNTCIYCAH